MRSILAVLLVPALFGATSPLSAPHVHAYTDHDHADHHHGPAVHDHDDDAHDASPAPAPDYSPALNGCNAGRHAVALKYVCAQTTPSPAIGSPASVQSFARPVEQLVRPTISYCDVRVHGPPILEAVSPRPPPTSLRQVS